MASLSIDEHDRSEDPEIFKLQHIVYPDHHLYRDPVQTRKYWQWKYFSNPAIPSKVYVVKGEDGRTIAGMRPVSFLPVQVEGKTLLSALLTAVITHPGYRKRGIFSSLVKRSLEEARKQGADFAFTFPNEQSFAIYRKIPEWHCLGNLALYVRPIRPLRLLRAGLSRLPAIGYLLRLNHGKAEGSDSTGRFIADHREIRIRTVERFNEDADRLWERVGPSFEVVIKRDAAHLNWRYADNPVSKYRVIEARERKDNALKGYLVSTIQERGGMSLGLIVDLLVEGGQPSVARALISEANAHFKREGVMLAACLMNRKSPYVGNLLWRGYLPIHDRINPKKFHVVCSLLGDGPAFAENLLDFDRWHLTWGDTDNV